MRVFAEAIDKLEAHLLEDSTNLFKEHLRVRGQGIDGGTVLVSVHFGGLNTKDQIQRDGVINVGPGFLVDNFYHILQRVIAIHDDSARGHLFLGIQREGIL